MFEEVAQKDFGSTLKGLRELNRLPLNTVATGLRLNAPYILEDIEAGRRPITRSQFEHIVERVCIQSCQPDLVQE